MSFAIPTPQAFEKVLGELLDRAVNAKPRAPGESLRYPFIVAIYGTADQGARVISVCELGLACSIAAALSLMPVGVAREKTRLGSLGDLIENFREVMNVISHYLSESGRRVALQTIFAPPDAAPPKVLKEALTGPNRLDLELSIRGYDGGRLSFIGLADA